LTLDTSVFTPDIVEILLLIGNRVSNMVWEAKLDRFLKPSPHSTRDQRLHFITAKYSERTYVQGTLGALTPDDHLLTAIKKNDIQHVLHALAQRANPNTQDRSRNTHAVYLALAAADPAAPASSLGHSYSSSSISTSTIRATPGGAASPPAAAGPARKPFAIAELLLQNGADIPSEPAPIPLTAAARFYLDFKTDQRLGRSQISAGRDSNGDDISALPPNPAGTNFSLDRTSRAGEPPQPQPQPQRLLKRNSRDRPRSRASLVAGDAMEGFVKK
jgi:Arf-GAP/SH3 domain/ANK repeat/PH domain-containing protein